MTRSLLDSGSLRLLPDFLPESRALYEHLATTVVWDTRIKARKSMSFGLPYNYSGIEWPAVPFPKPLADLLERVAVEVSFEPNNCLANYYFDGKASMGFHADSTEELEPDTGIAIVSLGAERAITFRRINDKTVSEEYQLPAGSLLWMSLEMQSEWLHAILSDATATRGRISLTFRCVKA